MTVPSYFKQTKSKWWLYDRQQPRWFCACCTLQNNIQPLRYSFADNKSTGSVSYICKYYVKNIVFHNHISSFSTKVWKRKVQKYEKGNSNIFSIFLKKQPCLQGMLPFWHWAATKILYCKKDNMLSRQDFSNTQPSNYARMTLTHF